ncbi:MAG: HEAT repeat domain-containing protein [Planctomycetia bacterium]|nr:HEAT repeat domain-containing protein [Planctomycetia bacterium]
MRFLSKAALCVWLTALAAVAIAQEKPPPDPPPLSPAEALKTLQSPADLQIEQVLAEPVVAQPVFMTFDERGRMWVVQYLQYPFPAGLKILSEDKFLRAVYDKVPPPPPKHFVGADKITIHEDTDGDGVFDKHKVFLEGLNIVTSCAIGRGGVWVLNPPYLLFYPDKNRDGVPDGDPEVHLEGFGLEDTHSNASCLRFGPDGWLYAAQGSTVSGHLRRPGDKTMVHSQGQLIWRYHPEKRIYEIFAEGGGNAWGVEIDAKGRVYSGHNGGNTRGFHYVQGGYSQKGFGKHGPLSNPFAFGYFAAMKHDEVPRFTHNFIIYEGGALPQNYAGRLFGVAPLLNHLVISDVMPDGSSYQTKDIGLAITTSDKWFRPVEIKAGPDGAIYVADMYEIQIAHLRHHEGKIDKTSGRIYRIKAKGMAPVKYEDLGKRSSRNLLDLLASPNKWTRQTALRLLGDRRETALAPEIEKRLFESEGQTALEMLWALNACGGLSEEAALKAMDHADPFVRQWAVRLLCDERKVSAQVVRKVSAMALGEPHVQVRSQLASSARRLPAQEAMAIVGGLLRRDEDVGDIHLPLLLWWAIEAHCQNDRRVVLSMFQQSDVWRLPLVREHIAGRLMQRFAQAGSRKDLVTCAEMLKLAPDDDSRKRLMTGFEAAFKGRPLVGLPPELAEALARFGGNSLTLGLRQKQESAVAKALAILADDKADRKERQELAGILGEVKIPQCVPALLEIVQKSADDELRMTALSALAQYDDPRIAPATIERYAQFPPDVRDVAQSLLVSRQSTAIALLEAVEQKKIDPKTVPLDVVRKMTAYRDGRIKDGIARHWGSVEGATTAEMQQDVERLRSVILSGKGSPYDGRKVFRETCAKCHKLFGEGGQIGPELTAYKRDDIQNVLLNVVNPSVEVREGFETWQVLTGDGRQAIGFLVDKDNQVVVLRGADGQNVSLPQSDIDEMAQQRKSIMPERLLNTLSEQQVRDLFAYLRSSQPLNEP